MEIMKMAVGLGGRGGEREGDLHSRNCLILVRDGKVQRDVEERAAEEAAVNKDNDEKDEKGGPTGAALEYYDDSPNSDSVGVAAAIVLRDGDGDGSTDYRLVNISAEGAFDGNGADFRGGNGS